MSAKSEEPVVAPRFRLDAVALTLFTAGSLLALAVAGYRPLSGNDNLLGSFGDEAAAMLVDALGWATAVFLGAWFVLAGLLVVNRSPVRFTMRLMGWATLTTCAAVAADWFDVGLSQASAAGRGGSVGAYLRFGLEDALDPLTAEIAFGASVLMGLMLAADWLVIGVLRATWVTARGIWKAAVWGNDRVAEGSTHVLAGLEVVAKVAGQGATELAKVANNAVKAAIPAPAATPDAPPIVTTLPFVQPKKQPTPEAEPAPEPTKVEDIPIHVHTEPATVPMVRAALPAPATEPPVAPPYQLPPLTLLKDPEPFPVEDHEQKLRDMAALLEKTCLDFGIKIKVVGIHTGPVITQYEVSLETGLRLNKVTTLADDLALNLRVPSVRVVAPLPGRNTVGIEVPNEIRQAVRLKELVEATAATPKVSKFKLPLFVGKDVEGRPLAYDLATMPHLLIAGSTGTGKSVCLNTIIISLLLTRRPDECRLILIDPKKVELTQFAQIPHLMTPVVKDEKKADAILAWAVDKMEERYEFLHRARVRNIATYNDLPYEEITRRMNPDSVDDLKNIPRKMPYIVIVIDEVGDLMMKMKKEIEGNIILLAQKARAAGIHLILATQKPTVDVVTGLIKSNLPARMCFRVTNRSDSAVVLDEKGAERLLGKGDMLFLQTGVTTRAQGALVEDDEIERVVEAIATDTPNYDSELLNLKTREQKEAGATDGGSGEVGEKLRERDPLYEQAVEIVIREQRGSTSLLQRALGIGYGKASRFVDFMAEDGIVGAYNGSNARQVLIAPDEWESRKKAAG
ncbi:MAG: DNA translocase FtsK [Planctomycetaceae bacterium]|nr:DNA translocase FtsK [Planctomycetaceae bacterium]